jgi:hypothetical protein
MIPAALRRRVWQRAKARCEYCLLHQSDDPLFPFHIEHIIARKHNGPTLASNLCVSCHRCNLAKSSNLSGLDIRTGKLVRLFHPRRHSWPHHFAWIGRVTVHVLNLNAPPRLMLRGLLLQLKRFPPKPARPRR